MKDKRYDDILFSRTRFHKEPTRINRLMRSTLSSLPHGRDRMIEHQIRTLWNHKMLPVVRNNTLGLYFEQGRLRVTINSSALRQELHIHRETIREQLNAQLGRNAVREIIFC